MNTQLSLAFTLTATFISNLNYGEDNIWVTLKGINAEAVLDAEEVAKAGGITEYILNTLEDMAEGFHADSVEQSILALLHSEVMNDVIWVSHARGALAELSTTEEGFDVEGYQAAKALTDDGYSAEVLRAAIACGLTASEIRNAYIGHFADEREMAKVVWTKSGELAEVPENAREFINWTQVAHALLDGDVSGVNCHYFWNY